MRAVAASRFATLVGGELSRPVVFARHVVLFSSLPRVLPYFVFACVVRVSISTSFVGCVVQRVCAQLGGLGRVGLCLLACVWLNVC